LELLRYEVEIHGELLSPSVPENGENRGFGTKNVSLGLQI